MTGTDLHQWETKARELPPSALRRAVMLALWLIAEKDKPLKVAVSTAANKHGATTAATLRQVKAIIPPAFFSARSRASARELTASWSEEQHNQRRHNRKMESDSRQHLATIKGEPYEQQNADHRRD